MSVEWTDEERGSAKRAAGCRIIEAPTLWCEVHKTLAPDNHCQMVTQILDALAPFVAAREAQAATKALREAANEMERTWVHERRTLGMASDTWLRTRADSIEQQP